MEIFQVKDELGRYYVAMEPMMDDGYKLLKELTLDGRVSEEATRFEDSVVSLVSNPSAPWKAAFLVWRNSVILQEIDTQERSMDRKCKDKLIELLALKYNVDKDALFGILSELEELGF